MLKLRRKRGESIILGDGEVIIKVLFLEGNQVDIGIEAPDSLSIHREEVFNNIKGNTVGNKITTGVRRIYGSLVGAKQDDDYGNK